MTWYDHMWSCMIMCLYVLRRAHKRWYVSIFILYIDVDILIYVWSYIIVQHDNWSNCTERVVVILTGILVHMVRMSYLGAFFGVAWPCCTRTRCVNCCHGEAWTSIIWYINMLQMHKYMSWHVDDWACVIFIRIDICQFEWN